MREYNLNTESPETLEAGISTLVTETIAETTSDNPYPGFSATVPATTSVADLFNITNTLISEFGENNYLGTILIADSNIRITCTKTPIPAFSTTALTQEGCGNNWQQLVVPILKNLPNSYEAFLSHKESRRDTLNMLTIGNDSTNHSIIHGKFIEERFVLNIATPLTQEIAAVLYQKYCLNPTNLSFTFEGGEELTLDQLLEPYPYIKEASERINSITNLHTLNNQQIAEINILRAEIRNLRAEISNLRAEKLSSQSAAGGVIGAAVTVAVLAAACGITAAISPKLYEEVSKFICSAAATILNKSLDSDLVAQTAITIGTIAVPVVILGAIAAVIGAYIGGQEKEVAPQA